MKTAVIISGRVRQIVLTPESEEEKRILALMTVQDDVRVESQNGTFGDKSLRIGIAVQECNGGYLRAYEDRDSVMLVLKPKDGGE